MNTGARFSGNALNASVVSSIHYLLQRVDSARNCERAAQQTVTVRQMLVDQLGGLVKYPIDYLIGLLQ